MNGARPIWVGADPGGASKTTFGVAVLIDGEAPITRCVGSADEAIGFIFDHAGDSVLGAGVDAPLWWSSGRGSDRLADQWLRSRYGLSGGEVQTANSLRGAALVQAAMFIFRLREKLGQIPVTESHPKALLKATAQNDWATFADRFGLPLAVATDHERDAIVGAVAAREGFQGRWPNDLSEVRSASEQDPRTYWLAPVHYYWPQV